MSEISRRQSPEQGRIRLADKLRNVRKVYLATFARCHAVMVPGRFVAAHTTRYERFCRRGVRIGRRKVLICNRIR